MLVFLALAVCMFIPIYWSAWSTWSPFCSRFTRFALLKMRIRVFRSVCVTACSSFTFFLRNRADRSLTLYVVDPPRVSCVVGDGGVEGGEAPGRLRLVVLRRVP